ncbi:MAG: hydroxymethylbilane synthase [Planctomycetaceae bacterium]|nr:hydroxymethylbilane synthase [Planctomycetaceae bacterium]
MKILRVGSRESNLAVAQAREVIAAVAAAHPDITLELVTMKTSGDRILDQPLEAIGGKGLFVKELDDALANGRVDICVHSCKDMPVPDNAALPVVAISKREDPADVLVLPSGRSEPDFSRPLGTSSPRRRAQLPSLFSGWQCESVRGNIQTRLRKLDAGEFGGLVLAAAGLNRLGLTERISKMFSLAEMVPAAGQGALAIQGRAGEDYSWLDAVNDQDTHDAVLAERAFIEKLGGGCSAPAAAYGTVDGDSLSLTAFCVLPDGGCRRGTRTGSRTVAKEIGALLADEMHA